jgi:hypothetical protein
MMSEQDSTTEVGWYISDVHVNRAMGYFYSLLREDGHLASTMNSKLFASMWAEALLQTSKVNEPSPIGPDQEEARKFLMVTIEGRLTQVEDRSDRMENALAYLNRWLHMTMTRYGHKEEQELERILYGPGEKPNEPA